MKTFYSLVSFAALSFGSVIAVGSPPANVTGYVHLVTPASGVLRVADHDYVVGRDAARAVAQRAASSSLVFVELVLVPTETDSSARFATLVSLSGRGPDAAFNPLASATSGLAPISPFQISGSIGTGIQGSIGTGIQGSIGTGIQGSIGTGIQGSIGTGIQGSIGTGIQGSIGTGIQGSIGTGIQGSIGTGIR